MHKLRTVRKIGSMMIFCLLDLILLDYRFEDRYQRDILPRTQYLPHLNRTWLLLEIMKKIVQGFYPVYTINEQSEQIFHDIAQVESFTLGQHFTNLSLGL